MRQVDSMKQHFIDYVSDGLVPLTNAIADLRRGKGLPHTLKHFCLAMGQHFPRSILSIEAILLAVHLAVFAAVVLAFLLSLLFY